MEKRLLAFIFVFLFAVSFASAEINDDLRDILKNKTSQEKVDVIIRFNEVPSGPDVHDIIRSGNLKDSYSVANAVSASVPKHVAEMMAEREKVSSIEPDYVVEAFLDESAPQINAPSVWNEGISGEGINIAIIDTGISNSNQYLDVEKEIDFTGEGTDDLFGHGTHVAGIVASTHSEYRGISPEANLFDVKALDSSGTGYVSDILESLDWSVENNADIISMSFGARVYCDGEDTLSMAVDEVVSEGIVVVAAAGNSGPESKTITSPGCSREVLTVGAVDSSDNIADFSSRGPTEDGRTKPDVVAPGVQITSTFPDGTFRSASGTSMSTPHVTGLSALLLEANKSLTPSQIKEVIKTNSEDLSLSQNTQGSGRIDAFSSYLAVKPEEINETTNETLLDEPENESFISPGKLKQQEDNKTRGRDGLPPGLSKKSSLPGNSFLSKALQRMDLAFTFNEEEKARKYIEYAESKLAETKERIENNETEEAAKLIESSQEDLEKAESLSNETEEIRERVKETRYIHLDVLNEVYENAPDSAKKGLENAISKSSKNLPPRDSNETEESEEPEEPQENVNASRSSGQINERRDNLQGKEKPEINFFRGEDNGNNLPVENQGKPSNDKSKNDKSKDSNQKPGTKNSESSNPGNSGSSNKGASSQGRSNSNGRGKGITGFIVNLFSS